MPNPLTSNFWTPPLPNPPGPTPANPGPLQTSTDVTLQNDTPPENQPYNDLPGITGVTSPLITAEENTLFAPVDGVTTKLRDLLTYPAIPSSDPNFAKDFAADPVPGTPPHMFSLVDPNDPSKGTQLTPPAQLSSNDFAGWATGYQLEYLKAENADPTQPLTIGSSCTYDATSVPIHAMLSVPVPPPPGSINTQTTQDTTNTKVYILENLQKTDFSTMSPADQRLIANTTFFQNSLSTQLGLIPSSTAIAKIVPTVDNTPGTIVSSMATPDPTSNPPVTPGVLAQENGGAGVSTGKVIVTLGTATGPINFTVNLGGQTTQAAVLAAFNANTVTGINSSGGTTAPLGQLLNISYVNDRLTFAPPSPNSTPPTDFMIQNASGGSTAATLANLGLSVAQTNTPIKFTGTGENLSGTFLGFIPVGGGVPTGTVNVAVTEASGTVLNFPVSLGGQTDGNTIAGLFNNTLATGTNITLGSLVNVSSTTSPGPFGAITLTSFTLTPVDPTLQFAITATGSTAATVNGLGLNNLTRSLVTVPPLDQTQDNSTVSVDSIMTARTAMLNAIAGAEALIVTATNQGVTNWNAQPVTFGSGLPTSVSLTPAAGQVFISELENLKQRVSAQSVFSVQDIQNSVAAITTRFKQLELFGTVIPPNSVATGTGQTDSNGNPITTDNLQFQNVISSDNNSTIKSGYAKMLAAEQQILTLSNQATAVSGTGVLTNGNAATDKHLDVPALIFMFQLNSNLTLEQENTANTELVNQQNALLSTYGIMQQIIHQTEGAFNTTDGSQKLGLFGVPDPTTITALAGNPPPKPLTTPLTQQQLQVISMFEDDTGKGQLNPIEVLLNLPPRPTGNFYVNETNANPPTNLKDEKVNPLLSTEWGQVETALSDQVTLINQNNQIQMNNINDTQKQQDRMFDLANNALSKASDIIQSIGRNLN